MVPFLIFVPPLAHALWGGVTGYLEVLMNETKRLFGGTCCRVGSPECAAKRFLLCAPYRAATIFEASTTMMCECSAASYWSNTINVRIPTPGRMVIVCTSGRGYSGGWSSDYLPQINRISALPIRRESDPLAIRGPRWRGSAQ
jgi:hypothetical protein